MSHVATVAEGLRLGNEYFCVLEDDIVPAPRLAEALDEAALKALPSFDALRLFAHFDRWEKPSKTVATIAGSVVVRVLRPGWGCAGQVYSRKGAEKIVATLRHITAPIDFAIYHDCQVEGLRVLETRPPLVVHDAVPSTVGDAGYRPDAPRAHGAQCLARAAQDQGGAQLRAGMGPAGISLLLPDLAVTPPERDYPPGPCRGCAPLNRAGRCCILGHDPGPAP